MVSYQEIMISSIGEFGIAQILVALACKVPAFFAAWSMVMMSFAGAKPKWWRVGYVYATNMTTGNTSIPVRQFEVCPDNNGNYTIVFDKSIYTIVSEWELVCDRDWIPTLITTVQMVGVLIGAGVVGQLGDLIGRKKCMILVYSMNLVFILLQGFSVNWQMMTVCVFFVGFGLGGYLCVCTVLMLEFISTRYRTAIAVLPLWALGVMCFGGMFKLLPNWRHLCYANAALGFPFLIAICLMPESIRWLFTQGRLDDAKKVLQSLAKRNGRVSPNLLGLEEALKEEFDTEKTQKHTYLSLLTYRSVRMKAIIFGIVWFYCTFAYYGLTLGVSRLAGDIVVNMTIMGVGEVVCMFCVWLLSKCLGRRNTTLFLMGGMCITSFGVTIAFFSNTANYPNIKSGLALTSRFFLSAAWTSVIIFTVESFPTEIRTIAYGFASVSGRIGGIVAPQNKTLSEISDHLPFTVNGVLAMISLFLCFFLKDTYHSEMTDKIEENIDIELDVTKKKLKENEA